jgi:hypothetical protein
MSKTSKSPRKVALTAYGIAQQSICDFSHRFSPKKFTQSQLLVCLVLKIFFKTDYRGIVQLLCDSPDLCKSFHLKAVPHFTTLQKASKRLLTSPLAKKLLESTVKAFCKKQIELAALDSTGLESHHVSRYFVRRKRAKQLETYETTHYSRFPKLGICCDCANHIILSAVTARGPSVDVNQFEYILLPAARRYKILKILADAGYDSESNHRFARDQFNIESIIPAKHGRPTLEPKPCKGKYRELMRTQLNKKTYGQRAQIETVISMIKRNQGDALKAKTYHSQNHEMILKVLTHNIGVILLIPKLFYRAGQEPFWVE